MEVKLSMKYIIADPGTQDGIELKRILDGHEVLEYQGSYTTFSAAENYSLEHPPDIAFICLGKAELNAFRLATVIRDCNPLSKVIFISRQKENAVEAFEYEADGFLMIPFNKNKIEQLLQKNFELKKKDELLKGGY
jgi:two-component SAPR family response regulator